MANFRCSTPYPAINLSIDNQPAANTRADGDVEDWRQTLAGTEGRVGRPRHVSIIAEHRRPAKHVGDPLGQWEVVPAFDLVRLDDRVRGVVHRAAKADADASDLRAIHVGVR